MGNTQCWVAAKLFSSLAGFGPELLISESFLAFFDMHKSTVKQIKSNPK
jgi:hypothetical protein